MTWPKVCLQVKTLIHQQKLDTNLELSLPEPNLTQHNKIVISLSLVELGLN